jgi:hypothetical protein
MEVEEEAVGDRWVDVAENLLPEEFVTGLVFTSDWQVTLGMRYEGEWEVDFPGWDVALEDDVEVTH